MGYNVIAPVSNNTKALFIGMKEFPTERVYLITPEKYVKEAKKLEKQLSEFTIESKIILIKKDLMAEMFKSIGQICAVHDPDTVLVNVATGDSMSTCAAMSAAFANGLKAFGVSNNKVVLMPIMKLSYYDEINDKKLKILTALNKESYTCIKLLAEELGMSPSLVWYHINGNKKYKGLVDLRLVEVRTDSQELCVKLSTLGQLLLEGYVKPRE